MATDLHEFAALVVRERNNVLIRWRAGVRLLPSAKHLDTPALNDHMPSVLDTLVEALAAGLSPTVAAGLNDAGPQIHGLQRLKEGFDIEEVVAEYSILRGCVHDIATENGFNLQGKPFHIINRVFDAAIGGAVQTYASQRAHEVQQRREEYLAFVAHDLRTPLLAIALAGRFLEQTLPQRGYGADTARMLRTLRRSHQQLDELVHKVIEENANLQSEAGVRLQRRAFDLWPFVEALIEELHPVADATKTRVTNEVPDDLMVFADASALKRALQNLIANAIRYTPRGVVTVGAAESAAGDVVECWVSDDGAGIAEARLAHVFDKGETDSLDDASKGLGLAIVQTLAEAHGGSVTVESEMGRGSTFRISLPTRSSAP
jgi:signal transduction histidine kinase